jgi:uncharacterized protein YbbC (DUF1343 family)
MNRKSHLLLVISFFLLTLSSETCAQRVRVGAEILVDKQLGLLADKRVGIICNHTSVLPDGTHIVDTLIHLGVHVTTLFGPEHGIRGMTAAGETVKTGTDPRTGLPVFSLYGRVKKPTPEMLRNVDVLVFDIQDVGSRFYTYASTMAYAMESAAYNGKEFIILDRPNPINGIDVEGPILDSVFKSFVGLFPIPIRHGMTIGEIAKMIVGEKWQPSNFLLTVIPIEGWKRETWYDQTGLPWVPPSPNMKTLATATVYPGTCLFEGTNVTEGRGTPKPFEEIGAPWINGDSLSKRLAAYPLPGVAFTPMTFTPAADSISAPNPKYKNEPSGGVYVDITDRTTFQPVKTACIILQAIHQLYPGKLKFLSTHFDRLAGTSSLRLALEAESPESTKTRLLPNYSQDKQFQEFLKIRKKYLLY